MNKIKSKFFFDLIRTNKNALSPVPTFIQAMLWFHNPSVLWDSQCTNFWRVLDFWNQSKALVINKKLSNENRISKILNNRKRNQYRKYDKFSNHIRFSEDKLKIDQIKRVSKEDNLLIEKSYFISEIIDSRIALSLKFLNFQKPITSNYSYTQSITACMRCNIYPLFFFVS